jgi:NADH:ubiquinone oxidoreductase subunit 6 (subunit J)
LWVVTERAKKRRVLGILVFCTICVVIAGCVVSTAADLPDALQSAVYVLMIGGLTVECVLLLEVKFDERLAPHGDAVVRAAPWLLSIGLLVLVFGVFREWGDGGRDNLLTLSTIGSATTGIAGWLVWSTRFRAPRRSRTQ